MGGEILKCTCKGLEIVVDVARNSSTLFFQRFCFVNISMYSDVHFCAFHIQLY